MLLTQQILAWFSISHAMVLNFSPVVDKVYIFKNKGIIRAHIQKYLNVFFISFMRMNNL